MFVWVCVYVPLPWLAWAAAARHCACIFMKGVWAADASFTCIYVYACICMCVCVCGVASATSRRCRCCCPPPQDLTLPGSTPNRRSPFLEHAGTPNVSTRTPGHRTRGRFTLYTISALTSHQYLRVPTETSLALRILETAHFKSLQSHSLHLRISIINSIQLFHKLEETLRWFYYLQFLV